MEAEGSIPSTPTQDFKYLDETWSSIKPVRDEFSTRFSSRYSPPYASGSWGIWGPLASEGYESRIERGFPNFAADILPITTPIVGDTWRDMHGRVLALQTALIGGTALVGGLIAGQIADLAGARADCGRWRGVSRRGRPRRARAAALPASRTLTRRDPQCRSRRPQSADEKTTRPASRSTLGAAARARATAADSSSMRGNV